MSLHFFAIPALDPAAAQAELNAFCQRHRVLKVERHLVDAGLDSHWVLCLQVADGPGPLPAGLKTPQRPAPASQPAGEPAARVDWKQVLDEADFSVFAQLRQARKALAEREGVPIFAVFSNEQLATMVRQRATSLAALGAIDGIGPARLERYGAAMLQILGSAFGSASTAPASPASAA